MPEISVGELIQQLSSRDPEVRYGAAEGLKDKVPAPVEAILALVAALSDEGTITRDVGDYYSGAVYETYLVADRAEEAIAAMLGAAAPRLREALRDGPPDARARAVTLLSGLGEEAVALIVATLEDESPAVRKAAVEALVHSLEKSLKEARVPSEQMAARGAEWVAAHRKAFLALSGRLLDHDGDVVRATVMALDRVAHGRHSTLPLPGVVDQALSDLLEARPDTIGQIATALRDPVENRRRDAAGALGLFAGRVEAAEALARAIVEDPSDSVVRAAAENLRPMATLLSQDWLDRLSGVVMEKRLWYGRPVLLELLGNCGPRAAAVAPVILRYLREGDPDRTPDVPIVKETRTAGAIALGKLGEAAEPLLPEIAALLRSDDDDVYEAALLALRQLQPFASRVVPILANELRQENRKRVILAAKALAAFGPDAAPALPEILLLLHPDRNWEVVVAAGEIVAAMSEAAALAIPALVELLGHSEHRFFVIYRLRELGPHARVAAPALEALLPVLEPNRDTASLADIAREALKRMEEP